MNSKEIRNKFFDFFKQKNHKIVPSAPMVIKDDPSLLFTNAGMNQFKSFFLGDAKPSDNRIANTQKCLRVSGKHNDLEEVGVDTYHHTMFEMLGNWSFGDYFKNEAIEWSWELLTDVYKLNPDQIYVTIFGGDEKDGLDSDREAYEIWKKIIDENRILACDKQDNFWEMGSAGPCGPCSEIHVDLRDEAERKKIPGAELVNKDHPQVIEAWNLVFMEYNRKADGSLVPLKNKHIDTGMGLERLCMIIQNKKSNYDTDVFMPLIKKVEQISGLSYNSKTKNSEIVDTAIRVVVDHIRAISFSIADGQLPSSNGAGYVIRRILRRAVRYGYQDLQLKEPFLHELVSVLSEEFSDVFPELEKQKTFIEKVVLEEESSFYRTLDQGLKRIDQVCAQLLDKKEKQISGAVVFELYDRFGFPVDLTSLIAKRNGMTIDENGFKTALNLQKQRSKSAAESEKSDWEIILKDDKEEFVGYDYLESDIKITRYREVIEKGKKSYQLVFNYTPFYPEGGGQVGDVGTIDNGDQKVKILDTKKENDLILHISSELPKNISASFKALVDQSRRDLISNNHTATHLLHQALREILGKHVEQKGSLVNDEYLRFDFSHFEKVSEDQLLKIEALVNKRIRMNIPLEEKRSMPLSKAKELGAMMLFGEKYGDVVRVIKFGESIELCGGIHVPTTSHIGNFKIISESSIAAGVRRVEAVTSLSADKYYNDQLEIVKKISQLLKSPDNPVKAIKELLDQNSVFQKKIDELNKEKSGSLIDELINDKQEINGVNFIARKVDLDNSLIKDLAFKLKNKIDNLYLVLGTEKNEKALLTVMISENLVKQKNLHAGKIVNELAIEIGGRGGGQPFFATAGGKDVKGIEKALNKAAELIP